jgi:hypothetical protein
VGWVDSRAGLEDLEKEITPCLCRESSADVMVIKSLA